jgi:hypothetical protein
LVIVNRSSRVIQFSNHKHCSSLFRFARLSTAARAERLTDCHERTQALGAIREKERNQ